MLSPPIPESKRPIGRSSKCWISRPELDLPGRSLLKVAFCCVLIAFWGIEIGGLRP